LSLRSSPLPNLLLFLTFVGQKSVEETSGIEAIEAFRPEEEHMKEYLECASLQRLVIIAATGYGNTGF
jgi:hypothetical protein